MRWEIYREPSLLDFLQVLQQCPVDERAQVEALTGEPFSPDAQAAGMVLRAGPKWVLLCDGQPVSVGGFDMVRPGVWQDWMVNTPAAFDPAHWRTVTRYARRIMDAMLETDAHRLQCVSLASRIDAHKWYKVLGYHFEGTMRGYCADGSDAMMFSRLRKTP